MRKLLIGLTAAAAIGLTAVPALAQVDFYAGPGGVGVEFGGPYGYYNGYPYGYYGYAPGWGWHRGWHRHYYHW